MLRTLRERMARRADEDELRRLRERFVDTGLTPIVDAPVRVPVTVAGEVQALQVVPRAGSPSLEVTLDDGTARVMAIFTGRRRIGGLDPGRRVSVEGVGRVERGHLVLLNPAYTILD